jgi:O-antigen/teichoic acid export membrane protein
MTVPEVTRTRPTTRGRAGRVLPVARRLGWGVADQAVSSASNFALGIFVARSVGADDFGAFSLAFLTYTVVLNASRGAATDPLLVRFSGTDDDRWRQAARDAAGTAVLVGVLVGAVCVVIGLSLPGPAGDAFLALGLGLPGLALQDALRFAFFAHGRGASALLNDVVWTVLLLTTVTWFFVTGHATARSAMLAFGATASVAALFGLAQARLLPQPAHALRWLRTHRDLASRYLLENVSISAASQLRSVALGAVVGLASVGYVRASEMLMGPFLVILMGVSQVAVPEAARALARSTRRLSRFCLALGAVQSVAALAWGVVLLVVFPLGPGEWLLDEIWAPTSALLVPITLTVAVASFSVAATAGLRALGVASRSLRAQLFASATYVSFGTVGAVLGGAVGTSWGVTAAQSLSALVWWSNLRAALEERRREQEPHP